MSEFARRKQHPDFATFDPDDMALFDRGYPNLVLLDDRHRHNKKALEWAEKAAGAVDPIYRTVWHTEVAIAFVHLYPAKPKKGFKPNPAFIEKRSAFEALEAKIPTDIRRVGRVGLRVGRVGLHLFNI